MLDPVTKPKHMLVHWETKTYDPQMSGFIVSKPLLQGRVRKQGFKEACKAGPSSRPTDSFVVRRSDPFTVLAWRVAWTIINHRDPWLLLHVTIFCFSFDVFFCF